MGEVSIHGSARRPSTRSRTWNGAPCRSRSARSAARPTRRRRRPSPRRARARPRTRSAAPRSRPSARRAPPRCGPSRSRRLDAGPRCAGPRSRSLPGGSGSFNDGSSSSSSGDELGGPRQSRYASDFKERRVLGRGGCGEVCEVLNRLDRRTYAIKKVRLTGGASSRDARRQLREVEALAAAFHPHVVRYYQAWIEGLEDAPIQEEFSLLDGFSDEDDDSDSDIISSSSNLTGKPATTTLYIQMEFCAATLRQLIDTRRLEQRRDDQWRLLRQILPCLCENLHDKLLVHRSSLQHHALCSHCCRWRVPICSARCAIRTTVVPANVDLLCWMRKATPSSATSASRRRSATATSKSRASSRSWMRTTKAPRTTTRRRR